MFVVLWLRVVEMPEKLHQESTTHIASSIYATIANMLKQSHCDLGVSMFSSISGSRPRFAQPAFSR